MLSAIDRNHCPLSIGTDVRNHRNPQPIPARSARNRLRSAVFRTRLRSDPKARMIPLRTMCRPPQEKGNSAHQIEKNNASHRAERLMLMPVAVRARPTCWVRGIFPQINSQVGQFQRPGLPIFDCSRGAALGKFETFRHVVGLLIAWIITLPAAALTVALCYL